MKVIDCCITFCDDDDIFMEILSFYLNEENIDDVISRTIEYKKHIEIFRRLQGENNEI